MLDIIDLKDILVPQKILVSQMDRLELPLLTMIIDVKNVYNILPDSTLLEAVYIFESRIYPTFYQGKEDIECLL